MKLLFDQNLSFRLCEAIADFFLESAHVCLLALSKADDRAVWECAKAQGFTIVSQDVDFAEMAALLRSPPKVIWLRAGNQSTSAISTMLRQHADLIVAFGNDDDTACLEIY